MFSLFHLRRFSVSAAEFAAKKVQSVAVIGSGLMGGGITQVALQTGHRVALVDINQKLLDKAFENISWGVKKTASKKFPQDTAKAQAFADESLSRLTRLTDPKKAVSEGGGVDLVIEAIVEDLPTKQKLFAELDHVAPSATIFSSNTSSLSIGDIMQNVQRKDRVGGTHFFSPVPLMKLVEVIRTAETSEDTFQTLMNFGKAVGKITVACKDTPLFIVNRLLVPFKKEALGMVERGDATIEDIDKAVVHGLGYPMGPFELADMTGVDVGKFISDGLRKKYPQNPMFKPSPIVDKLISEGRLGRKTGRGYYTYDKKGNKTGPPTL